MIQHSADPAKSAVRSATALDKIEDKAKERKMKRLLLMLFMLSAVLWIPLSSHADNESME